jgi:NitT/TauT family transport system ATP-binding protein
MPTPKHQAALENNPYRSEYCVRFLLLFTSITDVIRAEHLSKSFDSEPIIAGVSLAIAPSTVVAVVGPSGAGKTTLLNIIVGVLKADSGSVSMNPSYRIGYMLQEPALLPWRTLAENAQLGLELISRPIAPSLELTEKLFREFELNGAQRKYPAQCSLGMQQRAALIRTLAIEPDVLLLDEPFSSLDYDIKLRVQLNVMRYVEDKQPAVLLVTHDIEDAIVLADKVIVLSDKPASVKAEIDINLGFPMIIRVEAPKPISVDEHFRRAFYQYEVEAFQLGKGLLLSCFEMPQEMDSKYILFMQTDFAHFWHYITTGKQGDIATFNEMLARAFREWEGNKEFLSPLPHPRPIRIERPAMIDVV